MADRITEDYPGLVVHDGRQSGSITLGHSRLPVWAFHGDWDTLVDGWDDLYGWARPEWTRFLFHLFNQRRDTARLLCVLADVNRTLDDVYWDPSRGASDELTDEQQGRVVAALKASLAEWAVDDA